MFVRTLGSDEHTRHCFQMAPVGGSGGFARRGAARAGRLRHVVGLVGAVADGPGPSAGTGGGPLVLEGAGAGQAARGLAVGFVGRGGAVVSPLVVFWSPAPTSGRCRNSSGTRTWRPPRSTCTPTSPPSRRPWTAPAPPACEPDATSPPTPCSPSSPGSDNADLRIPNPSPTCDDTTNIGITTTSA